MKRMWMIAALASAAFGLGFVHPFGDPRSEARKGSLLEGAKIPAETAATARMKRTICMMTAAAAAEDNSIDCANHK